MLLVSEKTSHTPVLEAPAVNINPSSTCPVLRDPQNWGFFLDGKDNVRKQLCCGAKGLHDVWGDMIKQEKEGEFLTCVCEYIITDMCMNKTSNPLLCQKV